jgi:hypothetical protein
VKALGERARKWNGTIHRGDEVRVVGGKATEPFNTQKGETVQRTFVMAWMIKPNERG